MTTELRLCKEIGDTIRIKSYDWYIQNKNSENDVISTIPIFDWKQSKYCGKEAKITSVKKAEYMKNKYIILYTLDIDNGKWNWSEDMFDEK